MTTPSLNTFLEEKLKEFNKKFGNYDNSMFNVWKIGDAKTSEITFEQLKDFISASISEAWELNLSQQKNNLLKKIENKIDELEDNLSNASGNEGGDESFCDGYDLGIHEAFRLIDELRQKINSLKKNK